MDPVFAACQALGIGIAAGALAAAAGLDGRARATGTFFAAALGLGLGALSASADDESVVLGALAGCLGAGLAGIVIAGVVAGARSRGAGGSVGPIVALAALVVAGLSILLPPLALAAALGLLWLALARRRRSQRKFEGLRVLR
jgi:hypothetical protein